MVETHWMPDAPLPTTATRLSFQSYESSLFGLIKTCSDGDLDIGRIPACRVNDLALKVRQSGDVGPVPITRSFSQQFSSKILGTGILLGETRAVDEDLGLVFLDGTVLLNLQFPFAGLFIPHGLEDSAIQLHVVVEVPFAHRVVNILADLGARGIEV